MLPRFTKPNGCTPLMLRAFIPYKYWIQSPPLPLSTWSFSGPLADSHARIKEKVDDLVQRHVTPVTLEQLLSMDLLTTSTAKIKNAQFLQVELPIRLSHRVKSFEDLPFIVAINPHIQAIYSLYLTSLDRITQFPLIENDSHERLFSSLISDLLHAHSGTGFVECQKYMDSNDIGIFLDKLIAARIGVRVLALQSPEPNYIGVINKKLSPAQLTKSVFSYIQQVASLHYGTPMPNVQINGMLDATVTYIPLHLEYIMSELLKNAIRATVEHHHHANTGVNPPEVCVTIAQGINHNVTLRISDQGGGVPYDKLSKIYEYSYTTVPSPTDINNQFEWMSQVDLQQSTGGPIAGLGYGLGMARVYSKYFGGSLRMVSMFGYGCDVVLRLPNIDRSAIDVHI